MDWNKGICPPWYTYWGKAGQEGSFHLLPYHGLDVAACGVMLLRKLPDWRLRLERIAGLSAETLELLVRIFFAFHDLGKFATGFQNLRPDLLRELQGRRSDKGYVERHDTLGYLLWKKELLKRLLDFPGRRRSATHPALEQWLRVVTGHHGQPPSERDQVLRDAFDLPADLEAAEGFVYAVLELAGEQNLPLPPVEHPPLASWWLAGLMVLADWLGSNAHWFPPRHNVIPLNDYWETALEQAGAAIEAAGLASAPPTLSFALEDCFGEPPPRLHATPLQQWAAECPLQNGPALFLLEDVTGSGKTEAALMLAQRLLRMHGGGGLYFALPTMATANGMYRRLAAGHPPVYRRLFDGHAPPSLVLAHGRAELVEVFRESVLPLPTPESDYGDGTEPAGVRCSGWLADNRKKALLANVGVGTIDQALLAVLPSRHQSLRLLGLLGKVLIVDEVHACDAYMNGLLERLLFAHARAGGSAILLSATLPANQRRRLVNAFGEGMGREPAESAVVPSAYPLATRLDAGGVEAAPLQAASGSKRRVEVNFIHDEATVESLLTEVVAAGQCACWICNTVDDARRRFETLRAAHPDWALDLFHARFTMADRLAIEARVLDHFGKHSGPAQRRGRVLIATQVVEQSLDLDFDHLVSDLAPIDLLIQRAGRLHRHNRDAQGRRIPEADQRGRPHMVVLAPEWNADPGPRWLRDAMPGTAAVYEAEDGRLWLAMKLLREKGGFSMPEDARSLVEGVYGADLFDDFPEGLQEKNLEAEGLRRGQTSIARVKALPLEEGYRLQGTWLDEEGATTRLGEPATTLWLARMEEGRLLPLGEGEGGDAHAWMQSALTVRSTVAHAEVMPAGVSEEAWQRLKASLPNRGRWGVVVVLEFVDTGFWTGSVEDQDGRIMTIDYDREKGLRWRADH